eukprot:JP439265.1.p2 GENE.JP439265.1~~JP439265.1.p2  ORF type:complete len:58 (-),score=3.23 JP439265.1:143-316(-)
MGIPVAVSAALWCVVGGEHCGSECCSVLCRWWGALWQRVLLCVVPLVGSPVTVNVDS